MTKKLRNSFRRELRKLPKAFCELHAGFQATVLWYIKVLLSVRTRHRRIKTEKKNSKTIYL
jgi:hypothetical protein